MCNIVYYNKKILLKITLKKLFCIIIILFSGIFPSDYIWPNDYEGSITTTFAEPRFRRFHAGIDVRTYGEIGSNIYAISDGYINRIKIESDNYGKAIYLKLKDGNIALYSHLSKFSPDIEILIKKLQKKYNSSFFDHSLSKNEYINFSKGDVIGFTGDTGSLSGPHIHFEIRNEDNQPINPLLKHYRINDNLAPIAKSVTFIPLSNKSLIDGIQDYQTIKLKMINSNKYVIEDTISVLGEFGIALEAYDIIENLNQFKFGIYTIELLIDDIEYYSIKFDNYSFKENPLIYTEIDYMLLKNDNISHRLFNNENNNLSFIKSENRGKINLDKKFHNLIINVSDANNNRIQIQGILTGKASKIINANIVSENNTFKIDFKDNNNDRIFIKKQSKYLNVDNSEIITSIDLKSNKYILNNFEPDIDIIEYFTKNKDGIKSRKAYISSNLLDPFKINGKFKIKHLDTGLIIEFTENIFSGYNPKLKIISDQSTQIFDLYRKDKNTFSTSIIDVSNINKIRIEYDSTPEIFLEKEIYSLSSKSTNNFVYDNYRINYSNNYFYNETLIWIDNPIYELNNNFTQISKPISINPTTIPFKKKIIIGYDVSNCGNCGFYKYDSTKKIWNYLSTSYQKDILNTKLSNGGTIAILEEKNEPKISNLSPMIGSKYKQKDLTSIKFNIIDEESGINKEQIKIILDGNKLYYDYIHYRNLTQVKLDSLLAPGIHTLEISVLDNVNNIKTIKGEFTIIE